MDSRKRGQQGEFSDEALDALIGDTKTPEDLDALFRRMKKALAERILGADLTHHLGYDHGFPGFDQKVLSLYARGMTVREIQSHFEELDQIEIAPAVISTVTDAVMDEVTQGQQRPLDAMYPVVLFDCLRVKNRDEGVVMNR